MLFFLDFYNVFSIGKTAQLIPVDNDCLRSIFVYPEVCFPISTFHVHSRQRPFILLPLFRTRPMLPIVPVRADYTLHTFHRLLPLELAIQLRLVLQPIKE